MKTTFKIIALTFISFILVQGLITLLKAPAGQAARKGISYGKIF
jgi:hypothetical protein